MTPQESWAIARERMKADSEDRFVGYHQALLKPELHRGVLSEHVDDSSGCCYVIGLIGRDALLYPIWPELTATERAMTLPA